MDATMKRNRYPRKCAEFSKIPRSQGRHRLSGTVNIERRERAFSQDATRPGKADSQPSRFALNQIAPRWRPSRYQLQNGNLRIQKLDADS